MDPYANSLLQERLKALQYEGGKVTPEEDHQDPPLSASPKSDTLNFSYQKLVADEREEVGREMTQKLHAFQEGKGTDVYPAILKEAIDKRKEREGSRRKRKRELGRKGSLRQMRETTRAMDRPDGNSFATPEFKKDSSEVATTKSGRLSSEQEVGSALINVPISVNKESEKEKEKEQTQPSETPTEQSSHLLIVNNQVNKNLGGSPVVPRKSFLSYKGSWTLEPNGNEENQIVENEDDPDRKRVREYIASLSARLQQLPDDKTENEQSTDIKSPPKDRLSSSAIFPTPPNSATRTNSQSSDTPSSIIANWGSVHSWRGSTETPPRANSQSSSDTSSNWSGTHSWRGSTETPPNSAGVFDESSKPCYTETPPSSASFYPPTPPNSASSHFSETPPPSADYCATPPSSGGLNDSFDLGQGSGHGAPMLKRAVSCDSVSSDTSVTLGELEDEAGQITGYLSVEVIYEW